MWQFLSSVTKSHGTISYTFNKICLAFPGSPRGPEQWRAWSHTKPGCPWGRPPPQPRSAVPRALSDARAQSHGCSSVLCTGPAAVPEAQGS